MPPKWGEVWNVDFGDPAGHEQGKLRPAVVLSSDWFNETKAELHVVVPMSSKLRVIGTHYTVQPPEGGLVEPSDAMCEHIRAVSLARFTDLRGVLTDATMEEIMRRLKVLLFIGRRGSS